MRMRTLALLATLIWSAACVGGSETVVEEKGSTTESDPVQEDEEVIDLDDQVDEGVAEEVSANTTTKEAPGQTGPLVDLFGPTLLSLEMLSETTAQLNDHNTNEILKGKKVIGVYFSADWCGPCRQFTPELVQFYQKMNNRRGKKDEFQIVWVSRCRDVQSFGQYFTTMPWLALPPQEAMGSRGNHLSNLYGVKSIPTLVLLDDLGGIINKDGRTMIPKDKAGIGFPWRNPLATLFTTLVPRSVRFMIKRELAQLKEKLLGRFAKKGAA